MSKQILTSDTSALIILWKVKYIDLLKFLFDKVTITEAVREEYASPLTD